jgi:hypothetical protein
LTYTQEIADVFLQSRQSYTRADIHVRKST